MLPNLVATSHISYARLRESDPWLFVVTSLVTPVAVFLIETFVLGITAPDGSATVPKSVVLVACPYTAIGKKSARLNAKAVKIAPAQYSRYWVFCSSLTSRPIMGANAMSNTPLCQELFASGQTFLEASLFVLVLLLLWDISIPAYSSHRAVTRLSISCPLLRSLSTVSGAGGNPLSALAGYIPTRPCRLTVTVQLFGDNDLLQAAEERLGIGQRQADVRS